MEIIEYTKEQLELKHTKALLSHLNDARAYRSIISSYEGKRCCELCHQFISDNLQTNAKVELDRYDAYINIIKSVLSTREHVPNKQEAKALRKQKLHYKRNR
jgi:hypothetical protein